MGISSHSKRMKRFARGVCTFAALSAWLFTCAGAGEAPTPMPLNDVEVPIGPRGKNVAKSGDFTFQIKRFYVHRSPKGGNQMDLSFEVTVPERVKVALSGNIKLTAAEDDL